MSNAKTTLHALAVAFVERSKTLEYKGKKRDAAVMDFFLGAALALELEGKQEVAEHIKRVTCWILAIKGYSEVELMARGHVETYDKNRCLEEGDNVPENDLVRDRVLFGLGA